MKKIFNFRPIVCVTAVFVFGMILVHYSSHLWTFIALGAGVFLFAGLSFFSRFRKLVLKNLFFVLVLLLSLVSSISMSSITNLSYENEGLGVNNVVAIGRIESIEYYEKYNVVVLERVSVKSEEFERKLSHRLVIFDYRKNDLSIENAGDIVSFSGNVSKYFNRYYKSSNKLNNYRDIHIIKDNPLPVLDRFKLAVKETLFENMAYDSASFSYAMLFGSKAEIDESDFAIYSAAGIVHLLAVSGLNIGFLVIIFNFLFGVFRVNRKVSAIVISVIILIYASLCDFSASVTRATIMTIVSFYAVIRGRQYDGLNSIALTALIILLFSPFSLFDKGFVLSFVSVFSIFCLMPVFGGFFEKFFPKRLSSSLSLTLAAQVGTIPVSILFFGQISWYALLSNFLIIPITTVSFVILFVFVIIVMIIPLFGPILKVVDFSFVLVKWIATAVANLKGSVGIFNINYYALGFFYGGMICASDFCLAKNKWTTAIPMFLFSIAIILSLM